MRFDYAECNRQPVAAPGFDFVEKFTLRDRIAAYDNLTMAADARHHIVKLDDRAGGQYDACGPIA